MLNLKSDYKYDLVAPTSMGIRLVPMNRQPVHTSSTFEMQSTSAETNVINISSALGLRTKILTAFVKDSPISAFLKSELRKRNIDFEGIDVDQGGPWGYRHQINIADSGFGLRGPHVYNDRAGEVGRVLNSSDFDLDKLFAEDGVRILHLSGLICALSKQSGDFCLSLCKKAKETGTLISFDLNYRASFWKGRDKELSLLFNQIAKLSDILIGNEEDFQLALKIEGPKEGGNNLKEKIDQFTNMISNVKKQFPNVRLFANTLREVVSANEHLWGAIVDYGGRLYVEEPRKIEVLDRIGGGDGFVGGLLYSILKGFSPDEWYQFAWATGALAVSVETDYATPVDEDQIWSIYRGNARVRR